MKRLVFVAALGILMTAVAPDPALPGCTEGDCKNGTGTWVWDNENAYHGSFKNGRRTGHGTYTFSNGDRYVGEFLDGKFHGRGKYTYADGDVYDGLWNSGKMAGRGVLQRPDGTKQEGNYQNGAIVEKWNDDTEELREPDSNKYPRGHMEKLMGNQPPNKDTKRPAKK